MMGTGGGAEESRAGRTARAAEDERQRSQERTARTVDRGGEMAGPGGACLCTCLL